MPDIPGAIATNLKQTLLASTLQVAVRKSLRSMVDFGVGNRSVTTVQVSIPSAPMKTTRSRAGT